MKGRSTQPRALEAYRDQDKEGHRARTPRDQEVHVAARGGADVQDHASRSEGKLEIPGDTDPGLLIAGENRLGVVVIVLKST